MSNNFWQNVEQYRKLGADPLRWASPCSLEADPHIVKSALAEVRRSTIKITSPFWFDTYFHIEGKEPELTRRVYDPVNPVVDKEVEVKRALAMLRVHSAAAESPQVLAETLGKFFSVFRAKVAVTSAPVATTEHPDAQFALLDYIELRRGNKDGYMPALSSFEQVTDIIKAPDDEVHVKIALTDAIERLNLLGCGNSALFKFFPIYDAPAEEMLDRIRTNLDAFMSRYNLVMEDYSSLKRGRLFYGTSAVAITNKELPTRYEQVEEGMEVMITNKFGGLAAVSLHALALSDPANAAKFEQAGVSLPDLTAARDEALKSMSEPHFALGKIVSKYCPDFGQGYDRGAHITAVYPVGARGVFALGALAELASAHIAVNELPVRHDEIARLATKESLVENSTASQHGCHIIVGTKDVLNLVAEELRQHHFAPERIGFIAKKGAPSVAIEKGAGQYVAQKAKLARLLLKPAG
ncbi:SelD-related putative sulfur metabolism protein [Nitrososphaera viennensis]|uniref:SelD-related putative sulfur metabolism protein n=1 Tax=Nitrososphaera viennensis TaxID=1034015 RepID=A0A977IGM1_9ARCH|nr:SelD-related putative sulfur metabolism protein [Nitrososphaera viennensis]UVS70376.1 SelD-related putative sulfur metabolism protein [Nitrososphaera viennensis]